MQEYFKHIPKKTQNRIIITERDYMILRFLWKWKVVSTMAIAKKFFPSIKPMSAYRRLQFLETDAYIKAIPFPGKGHEVWTLADRGFKYILPRLGELKQVGYKSENTYHDFLASCLHLGEWLTHQPNESQNYSEQQLRRYPEDAWPSWVPRSTIHRPDGYSIFTKNGQKTIIAFEVELSVKELSRYESIVAMYDGEATIQVVVWLVESKAVMNTLKKAFDKYQLRNRQKHHFILLSDYLKTGRMTQVLEGNFSGKTLNEIIHRTDVAVASHWHPERDDLALFDIARRPKDSAIYEVSKNTKNSDCI